jgi:hypothetical protein
MLRESNARAGFFEPEQLAAVLAHLPADIQPIIRFASITGRLATVLHHERFHINFGPDEAPAYDAR